MDLSHVVKTTVYIADFNEFGEFNTFFTSYLNPAIWCTQFEWEKEFRYWLCSMYYRFHPSF